jgi:hypothetical protein
VNGTNANDVRRRIEMLNGDVARYRTDDLVRASEARRIRRPSERRHAQRRRARISSFASSVATLVTVPFQR